MSRDYAREMRRNSERWFPQMHDGTFDLPTEYDIKVAFNELRWGSQGGHR